ncbi:MAG: large conductance mechanosensitive channel protein MscL [Dehalococcoidia bacterium]|nr:large conductance mechanosensitive channel protein MscL [Dehalococcoidia bacterium]
MQGFRDFLLRGNVVELAVAVVIGGAFGAIVNAIVQGILTPLIGMFGGFDFSNLRVTVNNSTFEIGLVVNAIVSFLIIAAVVYFLVVAPIARVNAATKKDETPPAPTAEEKLLTEIRDLLKELRQR